MAHLTTQSGDQGQSIQFEVQPGETVIGRHPECTIVVDAAAVSRRHAKVIARPGHGPPTFLVADAGSRNGTFLNGELLSGSSPLRDGDTIRISDVEFVFHGPAGISETSDDAGDDAPIAATAPAASNQTSTRSGNHASSIGGSAGAAANAPFGAGSSVSPSGTDDRVTFDGNAFGVMMIDDAEDRPVSAIDFRSGVDGVKVVATPEAKLRALMRINRDLGGALSLDEVLPNLLSSLFEIFPAADRGFVVLRSPDGTLVPKWVKTRRGVDEETVRISRTIVRHVMDEGETILSFDAADDSRFDSSQSIADFSIRSLICGPLQDAGGQPIGALQIDSIRGSGQFRDEDVDLLSAVAASAGVAINNAAMHEEVLRQREIQQDLRLATDVQKAFLPSRQPEIPGFAVASHYQAANHIGGDYYDYIKLSGGRTAVVVADVVGHGVAAAMFMAKLSAETRFCLASTDDPAAAIERLNDRMSDLAVERFVTFVVVIVHPDPSEVTIVNAGHMPPVWLRSADNTIVEPGQQESGLPIAIDSGMRYESVRCTIEPGDVMVLYTDGVNEAMNGNDEEFGMDRIRQLTAAGGDAQTITDRLVTAVRTFVSDTPPFDDMALVVIQRI